MTWTIIKITKIDDHQKLSAPIRVAKLFAKTATVFAAESVSLYGNEVNTHTHTYSTGNPPPSRQEAINCIYSISLELHNSG
jgi:hypothetical protein